MAWRPDRGEVPAGNLESLAVSDLTIGQAARHESHHGHGLLRGVLDAFGRRTGFQQIADETFSQIRLPPASAADDLGVGPVQRDPGTALLAQPRSESVVVRVNVCYQHAFDVAQFETGVPESSD